MRRAIISLLREPNLIRSDHVGDRRHCALGLGTVVLIWSDLRPSVVQDSFHPMWLYECDLRQHGHNFTTNTGKMNRPLRRLVKQLELFRVRQGEWDACSVGKASSWHSDTLIRSKKNGKAALRIS